VAQAARPGGWRGQRQHARSRGVAVERRRNRDGPEHVRGRARPWSEDPTYIVPILLGAGERLLDNVGNLKLEQVRAIEAPGVTHIKYRVVK